MGLAAQRARRRRRACSACRANWSCRPTACSASARSANWQSLRHGEKSWSELTVKDGAEHPLDGLAGDAVELEVTFAAPLPTECGLHLLADAGGQDGISIIAGADRKSLKVGTIEAPFELTRGRGPDAARLHRQEPGRGLRQRPPGGRVRPQAHPREPEHPPVRQGWRRGGEIDQGVEDEDDLLTQRHNCGLHRHKPDGGWGRKLT